MKIIGIESSSLVASCALVDEDTVIAEYTLNYKITHSQTLLPMLDAITKLTELNLDTVDAIAVSGGPGSFTGLRIGEATAKGLGLALNKPLIHVPTLDAMAYTLWGNKNLICPIMDAKRSQVYTGIFAFDEENRMQVIRESAAEDIRRILEELRFLGRPVVFLGDGVPVFRSVIRETLGEKAVFAPAHVSRQRAAAVAALGLRLYQMGKTVTAAEEVPEYFRVSQAERERNKRLGEQA